MMVSAADIYDMNRSLSLGSAADIYDMNRSLSLGSAADIYDMNPSSSHRVDIKERMDFIHFVHESRKCIWDLTGDKIEYIEVNERNRFHTKFLENMKGLHKYIFGTPRKDSFLSISCTEAIEFSRGLKRERKFFCLQTNGYYIVKKYFTEGVQCVSGGEEHIYQTTSRPLDIYVFKKKITHIELNTLRRDYDLDTNHERISPEGMKKLTSGTYYLVIAPCHTCFTKIIINTSDVGNFTGTMFLPAMEPGFPLNIKSEYQRTSSNQAEQPSASVSRNIYQPIVNFGDSENDDSIDNRANGSGNRHVRSSTGSNSQSKRMRPSSPFPRASTSQMIDNPLTSSSDSSSEEMDPAIDNHCQTVFAVRNDSSIESYSLRSDSTFQVLQNNTVTGSFAIENDDMDPNVFEYHGEVQYIREVAKFKNGSIYETRQPLQGDLLSRLRDPKEKTEKLVVEKFFDIAYKSIKAAHDKFKEMKKFKMIGSCVPAIIPRRDARFCGTVSDVYEEKP